MSDSEEWVTIAEAAKRLEVTIPRLRRWLARPENERLSVTRETRTRTGTRTAVTVLVSVLPTIKAALEIGEERERTETGTRTGTGTNENTFPFPPPSEAENLRREIEILKAEREKDAGEVAFLRSEIERRNQSESELRRLMMVDKQELLELRQRLAITGEADTNSHDNGGGAEKITGRRWWEIWKK